MRNYAIKEIPAGSFFTKPVFLDNKFILTSPEITFSPELVKALQEWGFREVYSDGEPQNEYAGSEDEFKDEVLVETNSSDGDQLLQAEKFYAALLKYVEGLFTQAATKREIFFNQAAERIKETCDVIKENRRYLLRAMRNDDAMEGQNYLASHAVKSAIISIIIGSYIKLPNHRLIELGVAALLHEIGMIKLPPQVYLARRSLNPMEKKAILQHPILSFNLLKSFDFPLAVSLAALEHHERENGSGYPQKLTGDKISLYAKIIAVACSYEALTSSRPHKDAKDGYSGMLDLLKNEGKQYDDTVLKALVFSFSIYPIGLYVLLSSGKKGQVIDISADNPKYPTVQIFGELTPDGKNKVIETSQDGISIVRPLRKEEIGS